MTEREDVIALLKRQHQQIRQLFEEVEQAKGNERREAFRSLVRLPWVRETRRRSSCIRRCGSRKVGSMWSRPGWARSTARRSYCPL
jgi:hypothetical protein